MRSPGARQDELIPVAEASSRRARMMVISVFLSVSLNDFSQTPQHRSTPPNTHTQHPSHHGWSNTQIKVESRTLAPTQGRRGLVPREMQIQRRPFRDRDGRDPEVGRREQAVSQSADGRRRHPFHGAVTVVGSEDNRDSPSSRERVQSIECPMSEIALRDIREDTGLMTPDKPPSILQHFGGQRMLQWKDGAHGGQSSGDASSAGGYIEAIARGTYEFVVRPVSGLRLHLPSLPLCDGPDGACREPVARVVRGTRT